MAALPRLFRDCQAIERVFVREPDLNVLDECARTSVFRKSVFQSGNLCDTENPRTSVNPRKTLSFSLGSGARFEMARHNSGKEG